MDDVDDPLSVSHGHKMVSQPGIVAPGHGGKNVRMSHGPERLTPDHHDDDNPMISRLNVPLMAPLHTDAQHTDSILGLDERPGHIDLMDGSVMDLDLPSNVHGESLWDQSVWQHEEFH